MLAPSAGYDQKAYCVGAGGENYFLSAGAALQRFEPDLEAQDGDKTATAPSLLRTPLHSLHLELGAKMAPFAGYDMPLWYKSVSDEHRAVRTEAGIFDVAHMGVFDLNRPGRRRLPRLCRHQRCQAPGGRQLALYLLPGYRWSAARRSDDLSAGGGTLPRGG